MPKDPKGQKRPADVIGNTMRMATGDMPESSAKNAARAEAGRIEGKKGGKARAAALSDKQRKAAAKKAAKARWTD